MKKAVHSVFFMLAATAGFAQSKEEQSLMVRSYLLSHTVFGSKDSLTTEDLFSKTATYGHSSGKIETRREAIDAIVHNRSFYTDTSLNIQSILVNRKTGVVRSVFKGRQNNPDGTAAALHLHIMTVWVKDKSKWRLMGRQAVKLTN